MPWAQLRLTVTLTLTAGLATLGYASPVAASDRVELRGSVPAYADPDAEAGQVPESRSLSFHVVLGLRDRDGARALAKRVSDPRSDSYREFVSAAEFRRRFSWRRQQIRPVARWLRKYGMEVGDPTPNGVLLPAKGTAAEFEQAFRTQLGLYRAFGQELVAARSPLSVPRRVARMVRGTIGVPRGACKPGPRRFADRRDRRRLRRSGCPSRPCAARPTSLPATTASILLALLGSRG
ncbi:MAG: hypothetical protein KDB62_10365 [Solirubrobacterales bacterium]|nr:hypothetical protein [Solirubrobacterales bacterium]